MVWGIVAKVAAKTTMNFFVPGSGSAVDGYDAVISLCSGDFVSAGISTGWALVGLIPGGSSYKDVTRTMAEESLKASMEISKEVGQQAALQIAKEGLKGVAKEQIVEGAKLASEMLIKQATKEIAKNAVKEVALEALKETSQEVIAEGTKELISQGMKEGSKTLFTSAFDILRFVR